MKLTLRPGVWRKPADRSTADRVAAILPLVASAGAKAPDFIGFDGGFMEFEHCEGRPPRADDLPALIVTTAGLQAGLANGPLAGMICAGTQTDARRQIEPFDSPRRRAAITREATSPSEAAGLLRLVAESARAPAGLYKDSNVRNFIISSDGVTLVDFDEASLAPLGYDAAKLLVSARLSWGLDDSALDRMVRLFDAEFGQRSGIGLSATDVTQWFDLHMVLTRRHHRSTRP